MMMKVFRSLFLVAISFAVGAQGLTSSSGPNKAAIATTTSSPPPPTTTASTSVFSRRNFVATTIAAAAGGATVLAAGTSSVESAVAASTPNSLDLVTPNTLQDKVVVITGGTTGLGLESGKALAQGGATVVLTARTDPKGAKAVDTVQNYLNEQGIRNDKVYYVQLDLDNLDNVKSFPKRFQETLGADAKIDVLMNNAGVMAIPDRQLTSDGYERTFQSNHLGHFALTAKLAPYLKEDARVINVSSSAYQIAGKGLDLDNLNGEKEYSPWGSYGQSKLENILFTQELQRRADAQGIPLTVTSLHPGGVNTDLARNMMGGEDVWYEKKAKGPTNLWEKAVQATINKALLTPEEGAATQVYLASTTAPEEKGRFYSDLKPQKLPPFATDEAMAKALWERSEQLAGVKFSIGK